MKAKAIARFVTAIPHVSAEDVAAWAIVIAGRNACFVVVYTLESGLGRLPAMELRNIFDHHQKERKNGLYLKMD